MSVRFSGENSGVTIDGVRLELRRSDGLGIPILLLHEGLGSVSMWRDFPFRLARRTGRPVIAWSRQGYGWSDPRAETFDPDYMHLEADTTIKLMDALALDHAVLFGHSDGASIALIAAARAGDRVDRLILEAPHVYVEQLTVESIEGIRAAYQTSNLAERLGRHHRDPDHAFRLWNDIWLDERFRTWNIEDLLPMVNAPTLLIQGADDEYGTLDQLDRIEAAVRDTTRFVLPRCGHSPHRDHSDAVLEAVCSFLEIVASSPPGHSAS